MSTVINAHQVPGVVEIENVSSVVKNVQLYRTNTSVVLDPSVSLKLKLTRSEEYIYYVSLESDDLDVTYTPDESEE